MRLGKESLHTDFYYKLESLNEKIKLFTEVFYTSARSDFQLKQKARIRERHRQLMISANKKKQ